MGPTKETMIKKWIPWKKRGHTFYANVVAKELKLTVAEVCRYLSRYRLNGKLKYNGVIWMVV